MEEKIDIFRTSADPEHTFSFVSTPNNRLLLEVFLHNHHSFLKRVVVAVKYIFGHKSQWGHWDLLEIDEEDAQRMWVLLHRHRAKILNAKK